MKKIIKQEKISDKTIKLVKYEDKYQDYSVLVLDKNGKTVSYKNNILFIKDAREEYNSILKRIKNETRWNKINP